MVNRVVSFIKTHYKFFWIIFSIFVAIFTGILLSRAILNLLNPIHSTLITIPIFGILFSFMPGKKSEDADVMLRQRMIRLIISWGSIIGILFEVH